MRETLGILLRFFLAAALGYLISGIRQKEQENVSRTSEKI